MIMLRHSAMAWGSAVAMDALGGPEALAWPQRPAGQRPPSLERRRGPLPQQHMQPVVPDLEHHRQRRMRKPLAQPRQREGLDGSSRPKTSSGLLRPRTG